MNNTYTHRTGTTLAVAAIAVLAMLSFAPGAKAATCSFTEDLQLGSQSEVVRCLQQYLNTNGYNVATSGVGAPGQETSLNREKTADAVRRWQVAQGITPATGTFGPLSRAKYVSLTSGSPAPQPAPAPTIPTPTVPVTPIPTQEQADALKALTDARKQLNSATSEVKEADDEGDDFDDAEDSLDEAKDELFEALYAYIAKNWRDAKEGAYNAMDRIAEARDFLDSSSGSDEDQAEEALEDAEDMIADAWDEVEEADEDGARVGEAEDLLNDAEDLLSDAEDALDDEDYDDVMDLVDEIEDIVDEALDSIED